MKQKILILIILAITSFTTNAQWTEANGPEGGRIIALINCGGVYFANTDYGMFKSADNCNSWQRVTYFDEYTYNYGSDKLATNDEILYYVNSGGTIYKSSDLGETWTWSENFHCATDIAARDNFVAISMWCSGGVSMSTNQGQTWVTSAEETNVGDVIFAHGNVYSKLGTGDTIFSKAMWGNTWSPTEILTDFNSLAKVFFYTNSVLVLYAGELSQTTNNGFTWQEVESPGYVYSVYEHNNLSLIHI